MYKIQRAAMQCYKCIVSMYAYMCVGMHQWNAMKSSVVQRRQLYCSGGAVVL